jgi:hypothetical protein
MCSYIYAEMYHQLGGLNLYALDYPVCTEDSPRSLLQRKGRSQRAWLMRNQLRALAEVTRNADGSDNEAIGQIRKMLKLEPVDGYEPCEDDYMTTYLNQASVKEALHVHSDIVWADCAQGTLR